MTKPYSHKNPDGLWNIPAADRNKEPILAALRSCLPRTGLVLEVASGTGQHVVYFANALASLAWQPSDPDTAFRASIEHRILSDGVTNVRKPLDLDVLKRPWPISEVDVVVCINMIHVAPWRATQALVRGSGDILSQGGVFFLYGPYRRHGTHTAPSNRAFDARLRAENPEWGVRDLEEVERLAEQTGFFLDRVIEMPANNLSLIFKRPA